MDAPELRWDITAEAGTQAECFVKDLLDSLMAGSPDIEVKRDLESCNTGNIYLEYEAWSRRTKKYEPSGIAKTEATAWAIVLEQGQMVVLITTERLKELGRHSYRKPARRRDMTRSKNPTRGVLIPLDELCRAGTKAMKATLADKYA
jgi:hypothetical protein